MFLLAVGSLPLASPAQSDEPPDLPSVGARPQNQPGDEFWWSDKFDRVRFTNQSASHYFNRLPVPAVPQYFFPPMPPPLGAEFSAVGSLLPSGPPAHPGLAAHVCDWFYPFLGSRLLHDELTKALQAQLQTYQSEKVALQDALRAQIAELKDAEPEAARQQLAALAEAQAPRIAALEAAAEKLRTSLRGSGLAPWLAGGAANPAPPWPRATERVNPLSPEELRQEAAALLHAAFFQEGLAATQRGLLREAAHEFAREARAGEPPGGPAATGARWLNFSPETARIRLPVELPAFLEKQLADYSAVKNGLKAELREVLRNPGLSDDARVVALKQLATSQAPQLVALEALAEDIRRALATQPQAAGPPTAPPLPPELAARISIYRRHKSEMFNTLHAMLASEPKAGNRTGDRGSSRPPAGKGLGLKESVAEFNRRQTALLADLNKETTEIRQALAEYARTTGQPGDRKSINDLLQDFEAARQSQEVWAKFRDYQTAVLLPGLSPGQRRLLFDAAVAQLSLPLPAGETAR